jgi:fibronectin-binding autotransporter adhesin
MKTTGIAGKTAMALMSVLMAVAQAHAQLTWGPGGAGGAGIWDAETANWYNGSADVVWNSGTAVFQGAAGIVTVSGTQSAAGLTFNSNFYTLGGGTIALTGGAISGTGIGITIASSLSGSTGLQFSGVVSRTISGDNSGLSGVIDVAEGFVRVGNNNALGSSSADEDRVELQGGTILQLNGGIALPKAITTTGGCTLQAIGDSSISGALSFGATIVFQLDGGAALTLTGSAGLGATGSTLVTDGRGRLILDAEGAGTTGYGFFIRGTDVTLQVNALADPFGNVEANIYLGDSAGDHTLALNGATIGNNLLIYANGSSRKVENMAAGTSTYAGQLLLGAFSGVNTTTVLRSTTTSGTLEVSGHLRDDDSTANLEIGNVVYPNSGTVLLSRADGNLYDGSTTIHSGLLAVSNTSGSATGSGPVTVSSGGALGGTGFIGGPVSVSGGVSPGIAGIGTLNVDNDLAWNGGQSWVFDLGSTSASDQLQISGDFLKSGGSAFRFDFRGTGALGTYVLVTWDGTTDFSAGDFSYTNLAPGLVGGFRINGNQLEFTTAASPAIAITRNGSNLELTWSNGSLQTTADLVNGPWVSVPGATSPYVFAPSEPKRFFRAIAP